MYLNKEPLYGNGKSKFILIKDCDSYPGTSVFKSVMNLFCKEQTNLSVLCFDGLCDDLLHGLNVNNEKIELLNGFSDPLGWCQNLNTWSIEDLSAKFLNFKGVLCIYSLTSLLIRNGADEVYILLHKLLNTNPDLQIVALFHSDVHDSREDNIFDSLASTSLFINPENDTNTLWSTVHYASGKVKSMPLEYKISESFELVSLSDSKLQIRKEPTKQPDPTANLTFNLRLKDEEKEAKDQLQLPYMKMQNPDEAIIQNLLENDFYDEEDPDDDLDI